jgi:hypothetical protein
MERIVDMQEQLKKWFESTGFPLETETARSFFSIGYSVEHSAVYADQESEKSREIDVLAYKRDATGCFATFFVSECKSSDKPWVVLTHPQYIRRGALWIALMSANARKALGGHIEDYLGVYEETFGASNGGYALKQAFAGQNDQAYAACICALKAASAFVAGDTEAISFAFPIIVVDAPIYEYSEINDGPGEFHQVQSTSFMFSAHLKGYARTNIHLVSKDALPDFSKRCLSITSRYMQLFSEETMAIFRQGT